jgi:hypothetical protein
MVAAVEFEMLLVEVRASRTVTSRSRLSLLDAPLACGAG